MADPVEGTVGGAVEQIEAVLMPRERTPLPGEEPVSEESEAGQPEPEASASPETAETALEALEATPPQAEAEPEETTDDSPRYLIEVEGQEQEVTLDELRNGYQRQADYTRKTQALAHERRELEQQRSHLAAGHQAALARLDELQGRVLTTIGEEGEPDWAKLREEDPTEYAVQREARREKLELAQRIAHERQAQHEAWKSQRRPAEVRALQEMIPEWSDPEAFRRDYGSLGKWLVEGGWVTADEWNDEVSHRRVALAEYARRYLQSTRARPAVEKKVANLPRVARPGSPRSAQRTRQTREAKAIGRLRRTGSVEDAASALLAGIEQ